MNVAVLVVIKAGTNAKGLKAERSVKVDSEVVIAKANVQERVVILAQTNRRLAGVKDHLVLDEISRVAQERRKKDLVKAVSKSSI